MSTAVDIKNAIKANLDALVSSGVLSGASISDIKKERLAADTPSYPWAYLMPPSIDSQVEDSRSILRTYVYDIIVFWKAENIADATTVENNIESILSQFDNDPTLQGTAMGGVLPVSSAPAPFQHTAGALIMAAIQIQAKQYVSLTF